MLQSIHLQGFKGFKDTQVGPFKMVNLILGGQNVGKTSLLEAVYLARTFDVEGLAHQFRLIEGADATRFVDNTFNSEFQNLAISFDGDGLNEVKEFKKPSLFSEGDVNPNCVYRNKLSLFSSIHPKKVSATSVSLHLPNQNAQLALYGQLVVQRKKRQLIEMLRQVEPRLEGLDAVSPDGEQRIYAELSDIPVALPLAQLGHGFNRLFVLFAHMLVTDTGLALIDEVENGIHYTALPTLFQGIKMVAKERQVQSLITTHSWDAIRAACEVFEKTPELFQVIRLERTGDNIQAVCIEGERMLRMMARDMEVR